MLKRRNIERYLEFDIYIGVEYLYKLILTIKKKVALFKANRMSKKPHPAKNKLYRKKSKRIVKYKAKIKLTATQRRNQIVCSNEESITVGINRSKIF